MSEIIIGQGLPLQNKTDRIPHHGDGLAILRISSPPLSEKIIPPPPARLFRAGGCRGFEETVEERAQRDRAADLERERFDRRLWKQHLSCSAGSISDTLVGV